MLTHRVYYSQADGTDERMYPTDNLEQTVSALQSNGYRIGRILAIEPTLSTLVESIAKRRGTEMALEGISLGLAMKRGRIMAQVLAPKAQERFMTLLWDAYANN